jgi:hypothetical protein
MKRKHISLTLSPRDIKAGAHFFNRLSLHTWIWDAINNFIIGYISKLSPSSFCRRESFDNSILFDALNGVTLHSPNAGASSSNTNWFRLRALCMCAALPLDYRFPEIISWIIAVEIVRDWIYKFDSERATLYAQAVGIYGRKNNVWIQIDFKAG